MKQPETECFERGTEADVHTFMRRIRINPGRWLLVIILSAVGCLFVGCQTSSPVFSSDFQELDQETVMFAPKRTFKDRTFKAGDELRLFVPQLEMPGPVYEGRIMEDGTITLPLIGSVQAAGKTGVELSDELYRSYSRIPSVGSRIPTPPLYHDPIYYVGGEVENRNRFAWNGSLTVWRAIQLAGGFTGRANGKKVKLMRADGKSEVLNILKAAKDKKLDCPVYPYDKIYVPRKGLL